jgi:hypothetical protein
VPVILNGVIADGAIVYGDWGLAKPNNAGLTIVDPIGYAAPNDSRGYYPMTGYAPRVGRLEAEPPSRPRPNTNFQREWSVQSDTRTPAASTPPSDPPQVQVGPNDDQRRRRMPYRRGLLPIR